MDLSERPTQAASAAARHPWELARFRFFARVLRASDPARYARVLDAGAGDGWFAQQLLPMLPASAGVTCWDAHYRSEELAAFAREAGPRVQFTRERPSEAFDLVLLLDVLEHVEQDAPFLRTLVDENLAPGGTLLFSVPAWQRLFTSHDRKLQHHRRYAPARAAALLAESGLTLVRRGGLFHTLLLPRALEKLREAVRQPNGSSERALSWQGGALLTRAVELALAGDGAISALASEAGVELPGLSWWALCRKR